MFVPWWKGNKENKLNEMKFQICSSYKIVAIIWEFEIVDAADWLSRKVSCDKLDRSCALYTHILWISISRFISLCFYLSFQFYFIISLSLSPSFYLFLPHTLNTLRMTKNRRQLVENLFGNLSSSEKGSFTTYSQTCLSCKKYAKVI